MVLKTYWPLLALGVIPVGVGLLSSLRHLGSRRLYLLLFVGVPMGILVMLALRNIKPWNPRYVAVVFPFLLAMLALGLTRLPGFWSRGGAILMIVLSFWSLAGHFWADKYVKADIRSAVHFIELQELASEDILVPSVTGVYAFYQKDKTPLIDTFNLAPLGSDQGSQNFFQNKLASHKSFWFVSSREWYFDPHGYLPLTLSRNGHLRLEGEFPGVKVFHWKQQDSQGHRDKSGPNHEH